MPGDSLIAPAQRPLGLIAIVLVVDLALCGAGAVMLSKGLTAKRHKEDVGPPKAPEQRMEQRSEAMPPPSPAPSPAPSESPSEAVAAATPPPDTKVQTSAIKLVEAKSDEKPTRAKDKDKAKTKGSSTTSASTSSSSAKSGGGGGATSSGPVTHPGGGNPEDPYKEAAKDAAKDQPAAGFDLKAESNKQASASGDLFARCLSAAGTVHGTIKVAYRVEADGRVVHPYAVENSTGNENLGICLADVIATWRFSQHTGEAQNAVRPFTYP
jgi:outer membrane biosynthesis protein TonB